MFALKITTAKSNIIIAFFIAALAAFFMFVSITKAAGPGCSSDSPEGVFCEKFFNSVTPGTTEPAFSRDVAVVNYDFGSGSPDASVNNNQFSAIWKGRFNFDAANYQFTTTTDDGVRLKIDGVLVIDKWVNQAAKSYTHQQVMTAGLHEVEMHYYENAGLASAKLDWFKPATVNCSSEEPTDTWCVKYYNNESLSGSHRISATSPSVDFNFGTGSPDSAIPNNYFSGSFTKKVDFAEAGVYKFTTTTDDGVRLFVDGEKIIDKFVSQPATNHNGSKYLNEGLHTVRMEYFEATGVALAKLKWVLDVDGCNADESPTNAFCARFFKPRTAVDTVSIDSKTVPEVNFNYGNGSPSPLVPNDNFAATFKGTFDFVAGGTYQFQTTSDDGVRLRVDGNLVIDKWVNQATTTYYALVNLDAGTHSINLHYFENGGQANVKLSWAAVTPSLACTSDVPTDKFCAKHYNGTNFDVGPLKSEDVLVINKNYGGGSPGAPINNDFFSTQYKGMFGFSEPGIYRFTTRTDDGVRLRVDGVTVIDKFFAQPLTTYTADVTITAGTHPIELDFFEKTGAAIVKLSWVKIADLPSGPGVDFSATAPVGTSFTVPDGFESMTIKVTGTENIVHWTPMVSFDSGSNYFEQIRFDCPTMDCTEVTIPVLDNFYKIQTGSSSGVVSVHIEFNDEPSAQVLNLGSVVSYPFTSGTFNTTGFNNIVVTVGDGDNSPNLTLLELQRETSPGVFSTEDSLVCDTGSICPLETMLLSSGVYRVVLNNSGDNAVVGAIMRP
jgi:hypothetical protein